MATNNPSVSPYTLPWSNRYVVVAITVIVINILIILLLLFVFKYIRSLSYFCFAYSSI
jgi:hypothetical protein